MKADHTRVWPLRASDFPIAVDAAAARRDALREAIQRQWNVLRTANPKFFDGPLLTVRQLDEESGRVRLQRDSYMAYAVQPKVMTGVISVGVTAVVCALGADGARRYLFGQRAKNTHMYPGLWELGPSGAMLPPAGDGLFLAEVRLQLQGEISEEIGMSLTLDDGNSELLCMVRDDTARSVDLVMTVTLKEMPQIERNWEYQECAWVTLGGFAEWSKSHETIATSAAIVRYLTVRGM